MSYRIEYDGRIDKYEVVRNTKSRFPGLVTAAFGLFLLLTLCLWQEGAEQFKSILIPGEDAVTVQAFYNMTNDLRSGAGIRDAVYIFCQSVIHGN